MSASDLRFSSQYWPKGTYIHMITVPWDSSYKDIVQFDGEAARDQWLDNQYAASMSTTNMTYLVPGESVVLPCPVTTAENFNYLYVANPSYSITDDIDQFNGYPRRYCYFITSVQWLSPAACQVTLQLDVWTTWGIYAHFTRAFVAQGHAAIANRNLWDGTDLTAITPAKMRRYLSTPEAVDPGGDFYPIWTQWTDLTIPTSGTSGTFVGVMSSVDLATDWGTETNPHIKSASGSIQEGILAGVQIVYFKASDFIALLDDLKNSPWVSRNIMQVWLAPGRMTTMTAIGTIHGRTYYRPSAGTPSDWPLETFNIASQLSSHFIANITVAPKLMTAPYAFIEMNSFEGSPLVLKPQKTSSLTAMNILGRGVVMAPWDRFAIYPLFYGAGSNIADLTYNRQDILGNISQKTLHTGDNLDSAIWITELPRFAFTSDGYLSWLAQSAHSRAWSYQNNDWNYHKGSMQNQLSYDQSQENLSLQAAQYAENYTLQKNQAWMRTVTSSLGGINTTDPIGSITRAAGNVVNQLMDDNARNLAASQFYDQNRLASKQSDENYALAAYAMRGDYQQTIAQLSATQKDAEITPPSVVGAAGGNGWNYAVGMLGFRTTIKVMSSGQEQILISYFKRFGYTINEMIDMPTDLRLMDKFTYWKLQESFMQGNLTEGAKNAIRGIFEKGTTVWRDPTDITLFRYSTSSNGISTSNTFRY